MALANLAADNKNYWLLLVISVFSVIVFFWYQSHNNPDIHYLSEPGNARWITVNTPFVEHARPYQRKAKVFKKSFSLEQSVQNITLNVKAFRFFRLFVDEQLIYESDTIPENWKKEKQIKIDSLSKGRHEIAVAVMNYNGPAALLIYSSELAISSDSSWNVKIDPDGWLPVRLATEPKSSEISLKFEPAYLKLIDTVPIAVSVMLIIAGYLWLQKKKGFHISCSQLRWVLLASWAVLSVNSIMNTNFMGFDWTDHVKYVQYILVEKKLPLATDGWQMFQSPLFYLSSAILVKFFSVFFSIQTSFLIVKIIPLLCGAALIEICYRCSRLVFEGREDLQGIALLTGSMMPMNLYMAQYFGNESMLALFSSLSLLILLQWIKFPETVLSGRKQVLLGIILGLALLTKVTAAILVGISLTTLAYLQYSTSVSTRSIVVGHLRVVSVLVLIAGWYFFRNWLELGKPFLGGWDPERGALLAWWQDPGYRYLDNFTEFGQALIYPVYSASHTIWDGFYSTMWADGLLGSQGTFESRPPWNYDYLLATVLLSLVPFGGLVVSLVAPINRKTFSASTNNIAIFCCTSVFLYMLAILYLYLKLPIYSTVKASYSLGILPCYAILITLGLTRFINQKPAKLMIIGLLMCWAITSYLAYFSTGTAS